MKAKNKLRILNPLLLALLCAVVVMTVGYFLYTLRDSAVYFENESKSIAQRYSLQTVDAIERESGGIFDEAQRIAADVANVSGFEQMDVFGNEKVQQYGMDCLQFLKAGEAEYRYGERVGSITAVEVQSLIQGGVFGVSEIYTDFALGVPCVAAYCPVTGNSEVDGVLAFYQVQNVFVGGSVLNELTQYYCFAEQDGTILESWKADGFKEDVSHNIYTYLYNISESKPETDPIINATKERISGAYTLRVDSEDYIVSCIPLSRFGGDSFVVQIYRVHDLLQSEHTLYDKMFGSAVFLAIVAVLVLIAFVAVKFSSSKQLAIMDEYDPLLGCNSYNKFIRDAEELLSINRFAHYAITYFDINKFSYLKDQLGPDAYEATLRYVSTVVKKMAGDNETYGHVMDDIFVMLLHYSDIQELSDRIKLLGALVGAYELLRSRNYNLTLAVGVYLVERERTFHIQDMIDRAAIAQKANRTINDRHFIIYDASIRSSYIREAEVEAKMEYALKNNEFKLFFQPKYSIGQDRLEGAEALVRWYDEATKSYVAPDSFIQVFEVNGFIAKVDRFMFLEVCRFMSEATSRGEHLVPISVNVSRVTATQPDFLAYYVKTKDEFKIADGFLKLEFTESFAYENYETLEKIVTSLKSNGFLCSIDDFGSGYSSFKILKELPMDELKLDRFFLRSGVEPGKDEILLQTVITLGKSCGMVVTQEGVETLEDLKRLERYGCDVIQGFYYSKPLPMSDFLDFMNEDTSLSGITSLYEAARKQKL